MNNSLYAGMIIGGILTGFASYQATKAEHPATVAAAPQPVQEHYILIFNRSDATGEASTSAEFNSEAACDAAKGRIEAMDVHAGLYDVMCIPKG